MNHKTDCPIQEKIRRFFKDNKWILILMAVLFLERLAALYLLGFTQNVGSDDLSYVKSGITFAQTGMITMHSGYPSAQIMPGMTWLIGLFVLFFGQGKGLWIALKLFWILMGTLSAWFIYQSVRLFAPKWCALAAVLPLLGVDLVWTDNLILTETPFFLCFSAMIYFTLCMGKYKDRRSFWGCLIFYMLALLFKANIAIYPIFAMGYLLSVRYSFKTLLKEAVVLACAVLCFLVPWSIRNYLQFDAFIPLTYGVGNPALLGTYQGVKYPSDQKLNYKINVDQVIQKEYAGYYGHAGKVLPKYAKYISLRSDALKAKYRLHVWAKKDVKSLIFSYGLLKPWKMINGTFYWTRVFNVSGKTVQTLQSVNTILCICAVLASLHLKKKRPQILFLALLYLGNVMVYALTYVFGRYNVSLMPTRYIMVGIALGLFIKVIVEGAHSVINFEKTDVSPSGCR